MNLLLDTHIWLWSDAEPNKLTSEVAREIANPDNERFLSAVSIWEVILLMEKNRIQSKSNFSAWFKKSTEALHLIQLPVTWDVVHELRTTFLGYRDPADRFLAASARAYNLTLVTADARLMNVPGLAILPNQ